VVADFATVFSAALVLLPVLLLWLYALVDVIRRVDLSSAAKTLWVVAILVLPYLGALIYLAIRAPWKQRPYEEQR
jgi:Phospholipase_D-nuclease N-terminal